MRACARIIDSYHVHAHHVGVPRDLLRVQCTTGACCASARKQKEIQPSCSLPCSRATTAQRGKFTSIGWVVGEEYNTGGEE